MSSLPYPITLPTLADAQVTRVGVKSPEDVVVVSALRTALTKGRKGGFKDCFADGKQGSCFVVILTFLYRALVTCVEGNY